MSVRNLCFLFLLLFSLLIFSGCTTYMSGQPSLTLLTNDIDRNSKDIKLVSQQESVSSSLFYGPAYLFVNGNSSASHEEVINKFLDTYRADLIVNARIENSWYGIPFLFMVKTTTVEGYPANFVKKETAANTKGGENK